MRPRSRLRYLLLVPIILALIVVIAELAADIYLQAHPLPVIRSFIDEMLLPSPAYAKSPYASAAFFQDLGSQKGDATYHSKYFNRDNDVRWISYQPLRAPHTVYTFGSSTLNPGNIPDDWTIPSQIQLNLGSSYLVKSYTMNGEVVGQSLDTLKQVPLKSGDVAVFYAGWADAFIVWGDHRNAYDAQFQSQLCLKLLDIPIQLQSIQLLCSNVKTHWYLPQIDPVQLTRSREFVLKLYSDAIRSAHEYCLAHGIRFILVVQPQLWSRPLTPAESALEANHNLIYDRMGDIIHMMWPLIVQSSADSGAEFYDFTHLLDAMRDNELAFFDGWHENDRANVIIGKAIADVIVRGESSTVF